MAETFHIDLKGLQPLLRSLREMPEVVQKRVLIPAATNAGGILERSITRLIPVSHRRGKRKKYGHYAANIVSVTKAYGSGAVVVVVGAQSGRAPHAHLVEEGTNQRFTNSKTRYRREAVRTRVVVKNGAARTIVEKQKISVGSFGKRNKRPRANRGRMPAFHSVARGVASAAKSVQSQLANDIRAGLSAEVSRLQNG